MERTRAYHRYQYYKHKQKQRKLLLRDKFYNNSIGYRVKGQTLYNQEGYNAFIDNQAAKRAKTPKPCSCYLCSISTKRDGYSISDKRRLAHGAEMED